MKRQIDAGIDVVVNDLPVLGDVRERLALIEVVAAAEQVVLARHLRIGVGAGELQSQHVLGAELFSVAGTYEDELAQRDGRWRITHRTINTTWTGGNPAVLGLCH